MSQLSNEQQTSSPLGLFPSFAKRSTELEHLDKGDYTAAEYEGCIVELKRVNRWLGDARALQISLLNEIEKTDERQFSVLDVGAGSGELLRVIADWARKKKKIAKLVGLELNERSVLAIKQDSQPSQNINALRGDVFHVPFGNATFDYVMCSLFTHHFGNEDVVTILRELARVARRRLFIIDLNRHPVAYFFYTTLGRLMLHNRLVREDGALSILRSFKPDELLALAERAGLHAINVRRAFPYRLILTASSA